jgi:hypothetical protein
MRHNPLRDTLQDRDISPDPKSFQRLVLAEAHG